MDQKKTTKTVETPQIGGRSQATIQISILVMRRVGRATGVSVGRVDIRTEGRASMLDLKCELTMFPKTLLTMSRLPQGTWFRSSSGSKVNGDA